ncbi:MAG: hypothetical protein HFJ48_01545, partial [Clostridia bacterium]|nr:hypothetical protein [Clostridia bacterium]
LFAVSDENISKLIVKKYQKDYKEIISYKNVYYFNAILKEIQKDKSYDRIVISEDLEQFANSNYQQMDKFIFDKLDDISDEAYNAQGENIPIIVICSERRQKGEEILVKLFGIGVYDAVIGKDRKIDEVCNLIKRPRSKKEAKEYYRIDTDNVSYQPESENDVSEIEIQNILAHYKRLGKNEDKYVESFNNIAIQYNDAQLKLICKVLPMNVKAVLEEKSQKYQQLMAFNKSVAENIRKSSKDKKQEESGTSEKLLVSQASKPAISKPVVIPSNVKTNQSKKLTRASEQIIQPKKEDLIQNDIEMLLNSIDTQADKDKEIDRKLDLELGIDTSEEQQAPKRGRGRPKKNTTAPVEVKEEATKEEVPAQPKRGRGRPRKNAVEPVEEKIVLPGFEEEDNTVLPGFEEEENNNIIPGFEEENDNIIPGFNDEESDEEENSEDRAIASTQSYSNTNIAELLTKDKKIVTFVGTSKNGTSFILNNIAELLSSQGINVAILDATQNKNAYYIYTKNEESLRRIAYSSLKDLGRGSARGIKVNNNLTVYTSLPHDKESINEVDTILETLVKNHSLVLIDCDFNTPMEYFRYAQEIYLVQSMDVLTIQPLTEFLRDLKTQEILTESKIRIIINQYVKLRSVTDKTIIGGMAFYNDPAMTYMTELFDRNTVKYITVPFEQDIYTKYLEGLINCNISLRGYSKGFIQTLKQLASSVYPLISGKIKYKNNDRHAKTGMTSYKEEVEKVENAEDNNDEEIPEEPLGFSESINTTLDQMKKNY